MMRWLVIGVTALALVWSGYWVVGRTGVLRGVEAGAVQARATGWGLDWEALSVAGFPNRFDTTVTAPQVATPDGRWRWSAPFLQVFALSYRPNHVIAVMAPSQQIDGPFGPISVTSEDLRGSVVVAPDPGLALRRVTVGAQGVAADTRRGGLGLRAAQVALREVEELAGDDAPRYDLALDVQGFDLPPGALADLGLRGALPDRIEALGFDGTVTTDRPLDRYLAGPPGVLGWDIRALSLEWGAVEAVVSGVLTADAQGLAEGALSVELADLDATLDALSGVVSQAQRDFAQRFLVGFAVPGQPGAVRIELQVTGGLVSLGPIPLVALPPLNPRRS